MKIAVLGTGAIGSLFACRFSNDPENEILCIVKSKKHADSINTEGITLQDSENNVQNFIHLRAVTSTIGEKPADFVLISVKSQHTLSAVKEHQNIFHKDTIVLSLQNGYGNYEDILTSCPSANIIVGTTAQGVNIADSGLIIHAGNGPTTIGVSDPDSPNAAQNLKTTQALLQSSGFETTISSSVSDAIFRKLLINIGINALCALNNTENRFINLDKDMSAQSQKLVFEAVEILEAGGFTYDKEEIWHTVQTVAENTGHNRCSMLQDVSAGRTTEIRKINGAIVTMAEKLGIDAPENRKIMQLIETKFHSIQD